MKKIILTICILLFTFVAFAETPSVQVFKEKGKLDTITIEFIKEFDEARFIYTIPSSLFDKGDTIEKINDRQILIRTEEIKDFLTLETVTNGDLRKIISRIIVNRDGEIKIYLRDFSELMIV